MKDCKTLSFWAWNGDMNGSEITNQLEDLANKGIGGVFAHSRAGLKIEYLGEKWFDAFGHSVSECERLGLDLYIYDEDGWPSGFAGGKVFSSNEEFKERYLVCNEYDPPYDDLPDNIVAIYKAVNDGFVFLGDSKVCLSGERDRIIAICIVTNDVYVDILNREAMQYFIETTHEEYKKRFGKYFGGVIKGIFTDEPHLSPNGIPWGKYVALSFKDINGYDILNALPYMFHKKGNYKKYRYDFWKNISKLMVENYAKPYYEWSEQNNLEFTGHYTCEEGQVDQVATSGGVMPLYQYQGIIGVDALGNRLTPAPVFKQAEAVSWQLGNKKILCETFACSGYDTTFSDIMYIWGYQAAMGVNVPCLSISMFSIEGTRKRDYPVFFSHQMPWWESFGELSGVIDYVNNRMFNSERESQILLIHPKTSVWCEKGKGYAIEECRISSDFRRLTESLLDLQRSFDYADEHILSDNYKIENGRISVGNMSYDIIMVPAMTNIEKTTLDIISKFAASGGKVLIVDSLPEYVGGVKTDIEFDFEHIILSSRTDVLRKYFVCNECLQDIEIIDKYTRRPALGFVLERRIEDGKKFMFTVNRSREEKRQVRIRVKGNVDIFKTTVQGERIYLGSKYDSLNNVTYSDVIFDEQEVCFIEYEVGSCSNSYSVESEVLLKDFDITTSDNAFVIEKVQYKIDDSKYYDEDYAIFATPKIYSLIDGKNKDTKITMKYSFLSKCSENNEIYLLCEDNCCIVYINGIKIEREGSLIDNSFGKYSIGNLVKSGANEIILERNIKPYKSQYDINEVFQSITNVFSYEYYVENIYLMGVFDVNTFDELTFGENCVWMSENGAYISDYTKKHDIDNFTLQQLPYFMGDINLSSKIYVDDMEENCQYLLTYSKPNFSVMSIYINGSFVKKCGMAPYSIDLTAHLKQGVNDIDIKLTSTARNFFGPFHHIKGRHNEVGHTIFKGYVEYEDPVVFPELIGKSTWTDEMSFAPFGLSQLKLIKLKQ